MSDELREKIAAYIFEKTPVNWEFAMVMATSIIAMEQSHLRTGIEAACVKACEEIAKGEHIEDCEHICFELCPSCIAKKALERE